MISWLAGADEFPPLEHALCEPNGLLCAGGDLSPQRLLAAYRAGIFPWFAAGQPILWWSPDPRMVLVPNEFRIARSLRRTLRRGAYEVRLDSDFDALITACATTPRKGQAGTWITADMQAAYCRMHELGYAHSVEVWVRQTLVGGVYGLSIGKMFYGESMFSLLTDASKIALAHLARHLATLGYGLIDCQMKTAHLASLGAHEIPRADFIGRLRALTAGADDNALWPVAAASKPWS